MRPNPTCSFALPCSRQRILRPVLGDTSGVSLFCFLTATTVFSGFDRPCCWRCLPSVCFRFAQVTLREVMGNGPPRAFRDLEPIERERLYWDMKAQTTTRRGVELQRQQAPPVRFGPPSAQAEQPRRGRRARVLTSDQRRERLAQGQSEMDTGAGQVRSPHPGSHDR